MSIDSWVAPPDGWLLWSDDDYEIYMDEHELPGEQLAKGAAFASLVAAWPRVLGRSWKRSHAALHRFFTEGYVDSADLAPLLTQLAAGEDALGDDAARYAMTFDAIRSLAKIAKRRKRGLVHDGVEWPRPKKPAAKKPAAKKPAAKKSSAGASRTVADAVFSKAERAMFPVNGPDTDGVFSFPSHPWRGTWYRAALSGLDSWPHGSTLELIAKKGVLTGSGTDKWFKGFTVRGHYDAHGGVRATLKLRAEPGRPIEYLGRIDPSNGMLYGVFRWGAKARSRGAFVYVPASKPVRPLLAYIARYKAAENDYSRHFHGSGPYRIRARQLADVLAARAVSPGGIKGTGAALARWVKVVDEVPYGRAFLAAE